jgi:hypothetical protein
VRPGITAALVLALLAIAPLGLQRLDPRGGRWTALGCGLVACAGLWLERGFWSGATSGVWLLLALYHAWRGALRFSRRSGLSPHEICLDAAPAFLAVGAGWLCADRFGLSPLGSTPPWSALTAVHYHYAGFAAALLAGLTGRALPLIWAQIPPVTILIGTPLVAPAGLTLSREVQLAAALGLAAGLAVLAALLLRLGQRRAAGRIWFRISAGSLLLAVAIAAAHAASGYTGVGRPSIPVMVWGHGLLAALGFCTCGLVAFRRS